MDKTFLLIGAGQFLLGSAFFVGSIFFIIRRKLRMKKWTKTTGVVTDVEVSQGMRQQIGTPRNTLFRPKVRFQTADGRVINHQPKVSNNWSNYEIGQNIEVYYDPQQSEKVMFGARTVDWVRLIAFAVFGAFFALFGTIFLLVGSFSKF
jgi:hypothetical protein